VEAVLLKEYSIDESPWNPTLASDPRRRRRKDDKKWP
jgi:hypothetical protein